MEPAKLSLLGSTPLTELWQLSRLSLDLARYLERQAAIAILQSSNSGAVISGCSALTSAE